VGCFLKLADGIRGGSYTSTGIRGLFERHVLPSAVDSLVAILRSVRPSDLSSCLAVFIASLDELEDGIEHDAAVRVLPRCLNMVRCKGC
jgi:hypothetical protein